MRLIKRKNPVNEFYKVPFLVKLIGTAGFVGYIPFASGTFGSLVAFGIFMIQGVSEYLTLTVLTVVFFGIGVFCSEIMRKRYGDDPAEVVIDEVVGQWVTYLIGALLLDFFFRAKSFDPEFNFKSKIAFGIIAFVLFRFFDIIKLQPAKYYDNKSSGFSIMMDDVVAGIYAGICSAPLTHLIWYKLLVKFFIK